MKAEKEDVSLSSEEVRQRLIAEYRYYMTILGYLDYLDSLYHSQKGNHLSGKVFFNRIYMILIDYTYMRAIRLFDRKEMHGKQNFSFDYIENEFLDNPYKRQKKLEAISKRLNHYRHKHLAHWDMQTAPQQLPSYISLQKDIKRVVKVLGFYINTLSRKHNMPEVRCYQDSRSRADLSELLQYGFGICEMQDKDLQKELKDKIKNHYTSIT